MSGYQTAVNHSHSRRRIGQSRHNHHNLCVCNDNFFSLLIGSILKRAAQNAASFLYSNDPGQGVNAAAEIAGQTDTITNDNASLFQLAGKNRAQVDILIANQVAATVNTDDLTDWLVAPIWANFCTWPRALPGANLHARVIGADIASRHLRLDSPTCSAT